MAEKRNLQRSNGILRENIANKEQQTLAAMDKNEATLAQELAAVIAQDETLLREQEQYLHSEESKLKKQLLIAVQSIQKQQ